MAILLQRVTRHMIHCWKDLIEYYNFPLGLNPIRQRVEPLEGVEFRFFQMLKIDLKFNKNHILHQFRPYWTSSVPSTQENGRLASQTLEIRCSICTPATLLICRHYCGPIRTKLV